MGSGKLNDQRIIDLQPQFDKARDGFNQKHVIFIKPHTRRMGGLFRLLDLASQHRTPSISNQPSLRNGSTTHYWHTFPFATTFTVLFDPVTFTLTHFWPTPSIPPPVGKAVRRSLPRFIRASTSAPKTLSLAIIVVGPTTVIVPLIPCSSLWNSNSKTPLAGFTTRTVAFAGVVKPVDNVGLFLSTVSFVQGNFWVPALHKKMRGRQRT
jgi:hypothetical protein